MWTVQGVRGESVQENKGSEFVEDFRIKEIIRRLINLFSIVKGEFPDKGVEGEVY